MHFRYCYAFRRAKDISVMYISLLLCDISTFQLFISDQMRQYMVQLRQELGLRLVDKVFDPKTDKPSKVYGNNIKN